MSFLELKGVTKKFGDVTAVDEVNLTFFDHEFVTILGPSGCGKTTILSLIAGITELNGGQIIFQGRDISHLAPEKRNIGLVFQNYALFPNLDVSGNILYGLKTKKWPPKAQKERLDELLELVELEGLEKRFPEELSGGQKQRVALARAMAPKPSVLLLDEPLSALDAKVRNTIGQELLKIQRQSGLAVIMVTHDQGEALSLADRVILMNKGRVEQDGQPEDLYFKPRNLFVADFLGHMNLMTLDGANNGRPFGLRYEEVKVNLPTEAVLAQPHTLVGKVLHVSFMGKFKRLEIMLNDFKTMIYADVISEIHALGDIKEQSLVAVTLPDNLWYQLEQ